VLKRGAFTNSADSTSDVEIEVTGDLTKPCFSLPFFVNSASAAWLTGGSVDKIEVYQNEGGVTHFRGGIRPCIVPAGYVGVSLWGGVFVALSGSRVAATVAASFFCFALIVCLR
jgi:hypothetical protein